jgi:hypothetical protein
MSFADPSLPSRGSTRADPRQQPQSEIDPRRRQAALREAERGAAERPRGSSFRRSVDWQHVGLLGAGLVVGALIGAGAALLFAPQSGEATRSAIRRQARFARHRASDAWGDLAAELAEVARRGRRRARRVVRRARWRASDAID